MGLRPAPRRPGACADAQGGGRIARPPTFRGPLRRAAPMPGKSLPDKSAVLALPPFPGLALTQVRAPVHEAELAAAWDALSVERFIGFDTESKPTFAKGEVSGGPDVVQFATAATAYVLQLRHPASEDFVRQVLAAPTLVKVGFGLAQDQQQLRQRLGTIARPLLDLDRVFRLRGYPRTIGIKTAVAVVFNQNFVKSKRVTTSNWARHPLEARQLLYAANDAWVALRVLQALGLAEHELPVWPDGVPPAIDDRQPAPPGGAGDGAASPAAPRRRRRRPPQEPPA